MPNDTKPTAALEERYLKIKKSLFDKAYGDLNPRQREAVFTANGPLLVLAGAGSGKTTVLVRRIAFLVRYGNAYHSKAIPATLTEKRVTELEYANETLSPEEIVPLLDEFACTYRDSPEDAPARPYQILAITFTNKAAKEIKNRLSAMFEDRPDCAKDICTGTFHSVCVRILRRFCDLIGYRQGFSIYDADDTRRTLAEAMRRADVDEKTIPLKTVMNVISRAKDRLLTPEEFDAETGMDFKKKQIARVYYHYQMILREANSLDFDDLIMQTVLLLKNHPEAAQHYQRRFRYVSVDEYQDTNVAQFALTNLLSQGWHNLMVVGDDDQSIYKFRGATIENILSFHETYQNTKIVRLEQNYRSTQNILDAANAVICKNKGRMGKTLWTSREQGSRIHLLECDDQNAEARKIVELIQKEVAEKNTGYRDFAVLYRMNAQSQSLEKAFARAGVPYRMLGGLRFTDRKEIRDVVAYLQLIANHDDNMRLRRIINEPKRKIGAKTLEALAILANEQNCSQFRIIERAGEFVALKNARPMLEKFADLIHALTEEAQGVTLDCLFDSVLNITGYRKMIEDAGEAEKERLENLDEFKSQIIDYIRGSEEPTLEGFLEETALVADVDRYDETADAVVMMTVHSAKGLEFRTVFLPGMEEEIFPGIQSINAGPEELEEERRLAYVAITRAKEELYILHTSQRLLFGRTSYNALSRFAREIPKALIQKEKKQYSSGGFFGRADGYGGGYQSSYTSSWHREEPEQKHKVYYSEQEMEEAPKVRRKKAAETKKEVFKPGDRVRHLVFGGGEIISVKPMGTDILYEIMFDRAGTKKLMATYARLKRE